MRSVASQITLFILCGLVALWLCACSRCEDTDVTSGPVDRSTPLAKQCAKGDGPACMRQADTLLAGNPNALADARRLYKLACKADYQPGCSAWGVMLKDGLGGKQDIEQAVTILEAACRRGDADGCLSMFVLAREGIGMDLDMKRAEQFLARSIQIRKSDCERGQAEQCFNVYMNLPDEPARGVWLDKACKLGYEKACQLQKGIEAVH